ncbi:MAG: DoxX family protein [Acidiferrobacter sp.]
MDWNLLAIPILARICLVILFPFSGLDKITHWDDALKQANSSFLRGGPLLLIAAIAIEFVTPICIVLEWHSRPAAFVLALFCVMTAILYHPFWKFPGFWFGHNLDGRNHFWDFLKNFGLVGGLLLIVISGPLVSATAALRHPASTAAFSAAPKASALAHPHPHP